MFFFFFLRRLDHPTVNQESRFLVVRKKGTRCTEYLAFYMCDAVRSSVMKMCVWVIY